MSLATAQHSIRFITVLDRDKVNFPGDKNSIPLVESVASFS